MTGSRGAALLLGVSLLVVGGAGLRGAAPPPARNDILFSTEVVVARPTAGPPSRSTSNQDPRMRST